MENKSKPFIDNQAAATFLDHYTKGSSKNFYDQRRSQLKNICLFLYVLLPVFQVPLWIDCDKENNNSDADGTTPQIAAENESFCGLYDQDKYYFTFNSNMYLTESTYSIVSLVLIIFISLGLIFKPQYAEGKKRNYHRWLVLPIMALSFLEILLIVVGAIDWKPYFSTFATPVAFLLNSSYLRTLTFRSCRLIAAARRMLVYLTVIIVFFAWIAKIRDEAKEEGSKNQTLGYWVFKMITILSGENFPHIMTEDYLNDRRTIFFYAIYLILGVYFILALMLAVFYQAYKKIKSELREQRKAEAYASIKKSWDQLVGYDDGMIDRKTALKFFRTTRRYKSKANILKIMKMPSVENDERIFTLIDKNEKNALERDDYIKFCNMITLVNNLPNKEANSDFAEHNAYFRAVTSLATSYTFEAFMLFVCFANLVLLAVEQGNDWSDEWWIQVQLGLAALYFFEITIMLLSGADKFLSSINNIIEAFLTIYSLFVLLDGYFNTLKADSGNVDEDTTGIDFVKYAILIRMFRFFKIVLRSEEWKLVYRCITILVPTIITFFLSVIGLYYIFALAGIILFGGKIYSGLEYPTDGSFNGDAHQWKNALQYNYNDFPNAMISLFTFLFHPWNAASGVAMTTQKYSTWFFGFFWLFGVLMAVNIILPIVVHTFMTEFKRKEDLLRAKEEAKRLNLRPIEFVGKDNPYTAPELEVLVQYQMSGREGISS